MPQNKSETQEKKPFKIFIYIIGFMILWMMYINLESPDNNNPKLNILHFQNNKELICQTSLGGRVSVLVKKKNGYSIYKDKYFKKGNELINIKYCTQVEKEEKS